MSWQAQGEDWLGLLLWTTECALFPTWGNLTGSFEAWAHRNRWRQQWDRLEQRQLIARERRAGALVCRLTERGRQKALGGCNPETGWQQPWDGLWRQVLFDLPSGRKQIRVSLWRWLRDHHFGYLQHSVWVHPQPVPEVLEALGEYRRDVETFTIMEARCAPGYSDQAIVTGAWDFDEINQRHDAYVRHATVSEVELKRLAATPAALAGWLRGERLAWQHAAALDPFLPRVLWPRSYRGEVAWQLRRHTLPQLARLLAGTS